MENSANFLSGSNSVVGDPIKQSLGLAADALTSSRMVSALGANFSRNAGGLSVFVRPSQPSIASSTPPNNYKLFLVPSVSITGDYDLTVYPGMVNGVLTDNVLNTFTQAVGSTMYVILTCTSDGFAVTDSHITVSGTAPVFVDATINSPPTTFTVLLGILFVASGAGPPPPIVYQTWIGNITAVPNLWIQTTAASPTPFGSPFDNYYDWGISVSDF